jgi:hypothetical protein
VAAGPVGVGVASAFDTRNCAMCGVAANVPPLLERSHAKLPQSQPNRATNEHPTLHVPDTMIVSRDGDSAVHSGAVRLRRGRMRMTLYMNGAAASAGLNGTIVWSEPGHWSCWDYAARRPLEVPFSKRAIRLLPWMPRSVGRQADAADDPTV